MESIHHKAIRVVIALLLVGGFLFANSKNTSKKESQTTSPSPVKEKVSALSATFEGMLPCGDCSGLDTKLVLIRDAEFSGDGTYKLTETYTGKDVKPLQSEGIWGTLRGTPKDENATVIELNPDKKDQARYFLRVNENEIRQLDNDQNEIEGPMNFTLKRVE